MNLYIYTPIGHESNSYSIMAETQQEAYDHVLNLIRQHTGEPGYNEGEFMSHHYELAIQHQDEIGVVPYDA